VFFHPYYIKAITTNSIFVW